MSKKKVKKDKTQKANIAGSKISILRIKKGWSQNDLAVQLQNNGINLDKNSISNMEAGERHIKDYELKQLAELFQITTDELLKTPYEEEFETNKTSFKIADNEK